MNPTDYPPGSLVQLVNGGPVMVVQSSDNHEHIWCKWHDKDGKPCGEYYRTAMLRPAKVE